MRRAAPSLPPHILAVLQSMRVAGYSHRLQSSHAASMVGVPFPRGDGGLADALTEFRQERYRKALDGYILALADEIGTSLAIDACGHLGGMRRAAGQVDTGKTLAKQARPPAPPAT
eukprot:gene51878-17525_t